ncbi:MAG TPA: hypothetical protein ENN94_01485 [Geoalkalibacter subterraneus]|uniref:Uncharacterized protein n=1 Tax=Geoalkalibacter subterraneus TaxID=483547 RepID=A0A831PI71_9BACT|nr:hypothetical protein [Geoalkalibacter subterraneus]
MPLYLVADVIEEDFRLETVAHVVGRDRGALLARKLAQFFRTTEYRAARVQGREESGRRDDKVLFCALTNNEQISFWVHCILSQKAPLRGIFSVSWLIELLARFLKLDQVAHLLLVTLGEQSGLRQTYIQQGNLKFSRLSSLVTVRAGNLAETIVAECSHTRQYLERLKLLPRDQPLDIHFVVQGEIGEEVEGGLTDRGLLRFHLHESGVVAAELGIDPALEDSQGVVFVALMQALRSGGLLNIYGPEPVLRYYRLRRARQGLIVGTSLFFAAMLGYGFFLLTDGLKEREEQHRLEREIKQLSQQYQEIVRDFPDTPVSAGTMRKVVESVEVIQKQAAFPIEMMNPVSRAMAVCPDIHLQKFIWKLAVVPNKAKDVEESAVADRSETDGADEQGAVSALMPALLAGQTRVVTNLEGTVSPVGGHLAAHQGVIRFITALEQTPGLQVIPVAMPTETRPDSSLKATLDGKAMNAGFSLQLVYSLQANEAAR